MIGADSQDSRQGNIFFLVSVWVRVKVDIGREEMAIYCSQCGTALPLSARFCSRCGTEIPSTAPAAAHPASPLMRPRIGRQVAGVCLALSRAYGWDVAVVRIVAVIGLCFSGGFVGIAYLACWIGIPEEPLGLPGEYPPGI